MSDSSTAILLAEDDINLGNLLREYLEIKDYSVKLVRNGQEALDTLRKNTYDLIILDVMMPKIDGFAVAKEVRQRGETPVIFLTAKGQKEDKIHGFEAGADDYMTKPFSMEELLLRITAVLRRTRVTGKAAHLPRVHQIGSICFDFDMQSLKYNGSGKEVRISTKEAELLQMLCENRNEVLLRQDALLKIWGDDDYFAARSMDVYITKLRKYLKADTSVQIMNIHGKGYKLMVVG